MKTYLEQLEQLEQLERFLPFEISSSFRNLRLF